MITSSNMFTTQALIIYTILSLSFVQIIEGHAVLRSPVPFNTNPTTTQVCGVSTITSSMKSTAQATWRANDFVSIVWFLQAADGGGDLIGEFDPLGGTDFTVKAWTDKYPTSGSNKVYTRTFRVPADLDCSRAPNQLCTFRVYSSGWVSCTMVKICTTDNCPILPSPPKICSGITRPLKFCPNTDGASITEGYSVNDIDNSLNATWGDNLARPTVFATPTSECKSLYHTLLCGLSLPPCNPITGASEGTGACRSQCRQTMKSCSVTELHSKLYDCESLPLCNGEVDKVKGGMSAGGKAALSLFLIALFGTIAVAGFVYYRQRQLFGYTFDMQTKRIVKAEANPHNYKAYNDHL